MGTVNGTLRIAGVDDVEELRTVNGNIEVYGADSTVHAHTTNGNVRLELSHVRGVSGTFAETTNGSVVLALPANSQADLEARCLNGNFLSELPVSMQGSLKPREMHGKLGPGRNANQAAHHQRRHPRGGAANNRLNQQFQAVRSQKRV